MTVDKVQWIYVCGAFCVGIVKAHEKGFKPCYYIGAAEGISEREDIKTIIETGQKYADLDWLKDF